MQRTYSAIYPLKNLFPYNNINHLLFFAYYDENSQAISPLS